MYARLGFSKKGAGGGRGGEEEIYGDGAGGAGCVILCEGLDIFRDVKRDWGEDGGCAS